MEVLEVPGYEGFYKVSDTGEVFSESRIYYYQRQGRTDSFKKRGRKLKPCPDRDGYPAVTFSVEGGRKTYKVHRLVAMAFLGAKDREDSLQVNHINGIKSDNYLSNLEVVTAKENVRHSFLLGRTILRGSKIKTSKLLEGEIPPICTRIEQGESYKNIAKDYNVSSTTIALISQGRNWSSISGWTPASRSPKRKTGPKPI